ncbi:MAG: diguanylate cyclase [Pseudomonadota bacterium]
MPSFARSGFAFTPSQDCTIQDLFAGSDECLTALRRDWALSYVASRARDCYKARLIALQNDHASIPSSRKSDIETYFGDSRYKAEAAWVDPLVDQLARDVFGRYPLVWLDPNGKVQIQAEVACRQAMNALDAYAEEKREIEDARFAIPKNLASLAFNLAKLTRDAPGEAWKSIRGTAHTGVVIAKLYLTNPGQANELIASKAGETVDAVTSLARNRRPIFIHYKKAYFTMIQSTDASGEAEAKVVFAGFSAAALDKALRAAPKVVIWVKNEVQFVRALETEVQALRVEKAALLAERSAQAARTAELEAEVATLQRDPLSGVLNLNALMNGRARALVDQMFASEEPLTMVFFDGNKFGQFNKLLSQVHGNRMIAVMGEESTLAIRPGDLVVRVGGDEFMVLARNAGKAEGTAVGDRIASRIFGHPERRKMAESAANVARDEGIAFPDPGRIGTIEYVVEERQAGDTFDLLFERASKALADKKRQIANQATTGPTS